MFGNERVPFLEVGLERCEARGLMACLMYCVLMYVSLVEREEEQEEEEKTSDDKRSMETEFTFMLL